MANKNSESVNASIPSYEEAIPSEDDLMSTQETVSTGRTSSSLENSFSVHRDELERKRDDILPSFYMHQSSLNRSLYVYDENYGFQKAHLPDYNESFSSSVAEGAPESATRTLELTRDDSIWDNIEKVSEVDSPIELKVYLTKKPCIRNQFDNQMASALKEYTSGDYVYGYYTVKNISSQELNFEQLSVALEGNASVYNDHTKKQEVKNFLRFFDIDSGFLMHSSPLITQEKLIKERYTDHDGSILYLPNEQVFAPGVVYKKFFNFKLPVQLLDQSCDNEQLSHLMLPPSFGISLAGRQGVEFNKKLGYGRSNRIGGPIQMRDHAPTGVAIDYSIKVRIVGKNPNPAEECKYVLLKKQEHHLRFIPFGFCIPFNYELSTPRNLEMLRRRMKKELREARQRHELSLGIDEPIPVPSSEELLEAKLEQLTIPVFPLSNNTKESLTQKSTLEVIQSTKKLLNKDTSVKLGVITVESDTPVDGLSYVVPKFIDKINAKSDMPTTGRDNINLMDSALTSAEKKKLQNIELKLMFRPTATSTKPPNVATIKVELEAISVFSVKSIPFTIDQDFFTDGDSVKKIQEQFAEVRDEFKKLPPKTKILAKTVSDLNSIINMRKQSTKFPLFKVTEEESSAWEAKQEPSGIVWYKTHNLQLQVNEIKNLTLVPTFQSCYVSRFYNIDVEVSFGSLGKANLSIPVRVRKFDWQKNNKE